MAKVHSREFTRDFLIDEVYYLNGNTVIVDDKILSYYDCDGGVVVEGRIFEFENRFYKVEFHHRLSGDKDSGFILQFYPEDVENIRLLEVEQRPVTQLEWFIKVTEC